MKRWRKGFTGFGGVEPIVDFFGSLIRKLHKLIVVHGTTHVNGGRGRSNFSVTGDYEVSGRCPGLRADNKQRMLAIIAADADGVEPLLVLSEGEASWMKLSLGIESQ